MTYCTPPMLADAKLARELAQVATPDHAPVIDDRLMEATLRDEDRGSFDPEQIVLADAALVHVRRALADADAVIDGYLRVRKPTPYVVPLDPVPGIVSVWARWIARYLLHKDRIDTEEKRDPIVRDYREALRFLQLVADGKFSLGADDPLAPPSGGAPDYRSPSRIFTKETLKDFGR